MSTRLQEALPKETNSAAPPAEAPPAEQQQQQQQQQQQEKEQGAVEVGDGVDVPRADPLALIKSDAVPVLSSESKKGDESPLEFLVQVRLQPFCAVMCKRMSRATRCRCCRARARVATSSRLSSWRRCASSHAIRIKCRCALLHGALHIAMRCDPGLVLTSERRKGTRRDCLMCRRPPLMTRRASGGSFALATAARCSSLRRAAMTQPVKSRTVSQTRASR
jgi:hypothetical protein